MWLYFVLLWCWLCIPIHEGFLYPIVDPAKLYNYTPPEDQVTFYLYHYSDLSEAHQLYIDDEESIATSKFDPDLDTKIIVHGWTHGKDVPWLKEMRETMANTRQWNVIVVDWAPLSHVIYIEARIHTPVVSKQLALMITTLKRSQGISLASVHLIGHSMGAQISAYTGLKVKEATSEIIGRITGLDPAAPLYEWPQMEYLDEVLDPSDADFVDVIHTNGRILGMITPAGHVDYYPNGGETQPGCGLWICSHIRAVEFWTVSVKRPTIFKAYPFEIWSDDSLEEEKDITPYPMGILASKKIPAGTYFVKTGDEVTKYLDTTTTLINSYI